MLYARNPVASPGGADVDVSLALRVKGTNAPAIEIAVLPGAGIAPGNKRNLMLQRRNFPNSRRN